MDPLISSLVEYGMAGIFLAFMVWTYISNTKRMDENLEKFLEKTESLRKDNADRIETIRARYDSVISQYTKEKDEATLKIKEQMQNILRDLQQMETHFNSLSVQSESSNENIREMKIKLQELANNLSELSTRAEQIYLQVEASAQSIKSIYNQQKMEQAAKLALAHASPEGKKK